MERTLTKKEATARLAVTPERHRALGHMSLDRNKTLIEIADEALAVGIRHLQASAPQPPRPSAN